MLHIFEPPNKCPKGALSRVQDTPKQHAIAPHPARRDPPVAQNDFSVEGRWKFHDEAIPSYLLP
jgi:hypothetical protein